MIPAALYRGPGVRALDSITSPGVRTVVDLDDTPGEREAVLVPHADPAAAYAVDSWVTCRPVDPGPFATAFLTRLRALLAGEPDPQTTGPRAQRIDPLRFDTRGT